MAPKTKRVKFPTFSFSFVSKLPREKRNEYDIGVQYVISTLQAGVNGVSSYDSTLHARIKDVSSYDSLNGIHHTLRTYLDPVSQGGTETKTIEFPNFSFRSVFKFSREKRNECDIGVQYVISILEAGVNGGSSYDSTLQRS